MRYIDIDGKTYDVPSCWDCPCYENGDCGYMEKCKHPEGDGVCAEDGGDWSDDPSERYGPNCPLREVR